MDSKTYRVSSKADGAYNQLKAGSGIVKAKTPAPRLPTDYPATFTIKADMKLGLRWFRIETVPTPTILEPQILRDWFFLTDDHLYQWIFDLEIIEVENTSNG